MHKGGRRKRRKSDAGLTGPESDVEDSSVLEAKGEKQFNNNCFAVMRSSSEEGSYVRLVEFVSLNSRPRVIKKKKKGEKPEKPETRQV